MNRETRILLVATWLLITFVLPAGMFPTSRAEPSSSQLPPRSQALRTPKDVYTKACSTCHGFDGTGAAPQHVGFDTELPDFTDCSFATREPDADWIAVAHEGGPVRGFSHVMPAFGEALSKEDLGLAMAHIRTFCTDDAWPRGELNLPRAMVTEKAYPEDEAVYTIGVPLEGNSAFSNEIVYEKRFGARNQLELVVPFGWREQGPDPALGDAGNWIGGIGDVAIGAKRAIFHSLKTGSIFSVTGEFVLPTGDSDRGFGKGTTVFEPFASFGQILPSEFFLHAQSGFEFPFDSEKAEKEAFWRFALGRTFTSGGFGRAWSPMLEVLAARELVSDHEVVWDLLPQVHFTLNTRQHVMLNVGVRVPVTRSETRSTELLIFVLWDWFDGGFLEGW